MGSLPAGVTQTKNGRYEVRPYDRAKKAKGTARRFDTLAEAVAFKELKERAVAPSMTCDQWVDEWTTNPGYLRPSVSTNRHNHERVAKFAEDFKGVPLTDLDRPTARQWGLENKGRVAAVRTMLNDAKLDGLIPENPFSQLRLGRGTGARNARGRKDITPLTEKEVQALAQIAYRIRPEWPVMGANIITAAYTGLRVGELLALTWQDVDWKRGVVHVRRQWRDRDRMWALPKNGEERTVPLYAPVADALRALPKDGPTIAQSGRSEVREDGQPVTGRLIWFTPTEKMLGVNLHYYYWKEIRQKFWDRLKPDRQAVIEESFDFHELRHFTASWLVDLGARAEDVAGQLGHTDGGRLVQELYGHLYKDNSLARLQTVVARGA